MTFWAKLGILAAFLLVYGAAVWRVADWYHASREVKVMAQEDAATKEAMKASGKIDTDFSQSIAQLHQMEISANQSIEATHETPASPHCPLDPHRLSILRAAIAAGHPTR